MNDAAIAEISQQITDCENRSDRLTEWELGLIANLKNCIERGIALSRKQVDQLDIVWDRVTRKART